MKITIKQYEQAEDEKVSVGGIKWVKKWDVCVTCESLKEAEALKFRLVEPEKEQEPVGEVDRDGMAIVWANKPLDGSKLYTAPPQREPDEVTQAILLYKTVERLALQAGEEPDETIDWLCGEHSGMLKLFESYFLPKQSQREWVGLTDEEMDEAEDVGAKEYRRWKSQIRGQLFMPQDCPEWHIYCAIEAKLKEKNT